MTRFAVSHGWMADSHGILDLYDIVKSALIIPKISCRIRVFNEPSANFIHPKPIQSNVILRIKNISLNDKPECGSLRWFRAQTSTR